MTNSLDESAAYRKQIRYDLNALKNGRIIFYEENGYILTL